MPILLSDFASNVWAGAVGLALPGSGLAAPFGLEAVLEYQGLLLHDRSKVDRFHISEMEMEVDIRDNRQVNPGRDGEIPLNAQLGGRTIMLTGQFRAHNIDTLRDMEMAFRTAFLTRIERPLTLRHPDSTRNVYALARIIEKPSIVERQADLFPTRDFQVTLRASDPRWLSAIAHTISVTSIPGQFTVHNKGNYEALPVIRIFGPITDATITNDTIMQDEFKSRSIGISGAIDDGDWFEYDANKGTLVSASGANVYSRLTLASRQLKIGSGDNQFTVGGTGTGANTRIDTTWQDTWK